MGNWYKHVIAWTLFICYELSFLAASGVQLSGFIDYAIHYALNIALFYLNLKGFQYIFAGRFKKSISITIFLVLEIAVYLLFQYGIFIVLYRFHLTDNWVDFFTRVQLVRHTYRGIYFIGFSIAYWFALSVSKQKKIILELENFKLRDKMKSADLENRLMQAKNAYFQSQLNPHFLFNTLNFIYNSVRKVSNQGASAILLLSEMMRYSLSDTGVDGKVSLCDETEHIKNFITLNQFRFDKNLNVIFNLKGSFKNQKIIPLVLISFVENIYKHGDLVDEASPALINLSCLQHVLELNCINKKNKSFNSKGWGIGIENAKARLDSYYRDKYDLKIIEDEDNYEMLLVIQL